MNKYLIIDVDDQVIEINQSEEEIIKYAKKFQDDYEDEDACSEWVSEVKDFEIKDLDSAKKFLSEFEIHVVPDEDTECSLLLKRMLDKDEKCYFKIETKEYDYSNQGFWRVNISPLIYNEKKREMKIQVYATKHCPSGLWDNGIDKSKHYTICPFRHQNIEQFLKEIVRWTMGSSNYKIENWHIK